MSEKPNQQSWNPDQNYNNYQQSEDHHQQDNHGDHGYDDSSTNHLQPPPINYNTKPQESGETFNDRFKVEKPKWNDIPFALFFLCVLGGFIAVAVLTLRAWAKTYGFQGHGIYGSNNNYSFDTSAAIMFCFVTVVAFVLAIVLLALIRAFTKFFIYLVFIVSIVVGFGTAIFYLAEHYYGGGIVMLICAFFQLMFFLGARSRIPFATVVFRTVVDVSRQFPSIYGASLIGTIVATAFSMFFSMVLVATYMKYDPNPNNPGCDISGGSCSNGKLIGVLVFVTFAGYYISEVIKNVTHTTICGIYGTWYYCSKSDQGVPKHPALGSFRRTMTYSFGSVTFGSLIVAIVNLIRYLLDLARQAASQDIGNDVLRMVATCVVCLAQCFMNIVDWMVEYFNHYAYTFVALYGKAYLPAAKDTWQIIRARGIDALINDCLIDHLLTFVQMMLGYTCAMLGYCYLKWTHASYNTSGGFYAIVTFYSMFIGIQVGATVMMGMRAGTATLFVALAKDPEVFRMSYPEIYHQLLETYPQVREKLNFHE